MRVGSGPFLSFCGPAAEPGEWEAAITAAPKVAATHSRIYSQERRGMLEAMVAGDEATGLGREGVR